MKTFVLTFSTHFPTWHPQAGAPTFFVEKIIRMEKLHTIRANSSFWLNRFDEIRKGNAELSLRYWTDKPYQSPQIEFGRLGKEDGIGIQLLQFNGNLQTTRVDNFNFPSSQELAKNDGLYYDEWCHWFERYDLSKQLAIIWLCSQRYNDLKLNF